MAITIKGEGSFTPENITLQHDNSVKVIVGCREVFISADSLKALNAAKPEPVGSFYFVVRDVKTGKVKDAYGGADDAGAWKIEGNVIKLNNNFHLGGSSSSRCVTGGVWCIEYHMKEPKREL